jgi:hypothetical protein
MEASEIVALIQLAAVLEPQVVTLVNNMVTAFNSSNMTAPDRMKMINDLSSQLKPMELKV